MSHFIYFTDEQKEQARQTDLLSLLQSQGEKVKRSGTEYEWKDGSQKVTIRGNLWYHQYEQVGGDAIDFVRRFYHKDYPEAMEYLLGGCGGTLSVSPLVIKERKPFVLPKKNASMCRVYGYLLNCRGIDKSVLDAFVNRKMIYESADYHNAVFVGYDMDGVPRHAHKRGTIGNSTFRGNVDGSLPEFSFHWHGQAEPASNSHMKCGGELKSNCLRPSNCLYLFEAPIDMLSFISMHKENWQRHSYAAGCGVSALVAYQMMKDNPNIGKVWLCHDNDEGGEKAVRRISAALKEEHIDHERLIPVNKDWNEDLINLENLEETECESGMVMQ